MNKHSLWKFQFIFALLLFTSAVAHTQTATITISSTIGSVGVGGTINYVCDVTNTGTTTQTFYVGSEVYPYGNSSSPSQTGNSPSFPIAGGTSSTISLTGTIPANLIAGSYTAHVVVRCLISGSWTWENQNTEDFQLTTNGRIAFNSGTYFDPNGQANILLYTVGSGSAPINITGTLPLIDAVTPHFSPDGSKMVFVAVPSLTATTATSSYIYVLDLADRTFQQLTSGTGYNEDASYSSDGNYIVFKKYRLNLWRMNADGTGAETLTNLGVESSAPNYSPDDSNIVFYTGSLSNTAIWSGYSDGTGLETLIPTQNLAPFYPVYRDTQDILYVRWTSTNNEFDQIYDYSLSNQTSQSLPFNNAYPGDTADPFPVNPHLIGFSNDSGGPYQIYLGDSTSGATYSLPNFHVGPTETGGTYTPYSYARKVVLVSPTNGETLYPGASYVVQARAWSDGGIWSGASPGVAFSGTSTTSYSGLNDDGTNGDAVAGDGIYSERITLPVSSGTYEVSANATSVDNGVVAPITYTSGTVGITLTISYAAWCATYGIAAGAEAQSLSSDGVPNLVKYAFGIDPTVQYAGHGLPTAAISGGSFLYDYTVDQAKTDITYAVQLSPDLVNWTTTTGTYSVIGSSGTVQTLQMVIPVNHQEFVRVLISEQ